MVCTIDFTLRPPQSSAVVFDKAPGTYGTNVNDFQKFKLLLDKFQATALQ